MLKNIYQKTRNFSINAGSNRLFSKLVFTSSSKKSLVKYINLLNIYFQKLNINYSLLYLPVSKKRITLLKSPHVNKKAKEHFEVNTYKIQITLHSFFEIFLLKSLLVNRPKSIKLKLIL